MFVNSLKNTLNEDFNYTLTENGALSYRTTGKNLLDINFAVASLRSADEEEIINRFMKAYYEDKILAMKWLFFARDIRGGLGERRLFRTVIKYLADNNPEIIRDLIKFIPEYGRYDDMVEILKSKVSDVVINIISSQLKEDIKNMKENKPVSLLAKWLPSINASSKESAAQGRFICRKLGYSEKKYRKTLSSLRRYIDVVEVKMSANKWDKIKYETVPSRANLIYSNAFLRHDRERREAYLESLKKGEVKINAGTLFPHDIVHRYTETSYLWGCDLKDINTTLEELWKSLPNLVNGCENTIVVADGSGSMTCTIGNSNVTALSVANALAIYFSERSSGEFKDKYITFSERPQLVDFSKAKNLREKIEIALRHNEVANTNIEAVFKLILKTAIKNNMKQSDLPQNILIISDMEFDSAVDELPDKRLFENIAEQYEQHGYKLPRLIFWNVNSRTGAIPVKENDLGVALVSGFSTNIVKMVMSNELDPYKCLLEMLNTERYQPIENAIKDIA